VPYTLTTVGNVTYAAGKFGQAAVFPGNRYVYLQPQAGAFPVTGDWTLTCWLNSTSTANYQVAVSVGGDENTDIYIGLGQGGFGSGGVNGVNDSIGNATNYADGNWHFAKLTYKASSQNLVLMFDGIVAASRTVALTQPPVVAGYIGTGAIGPFNGMVDEVAFFNTYDPSTTVPTNPYTGGETGIVSLFHLENPATALVAVAPNDTNIQCNAMAWDQNSARLYCINAGNPIRVPFTGTSITANFDTSANTAPYPELWGSIDGGPKTKYILSANSPSIQMATGLDSRNHVLELVIKSTTLTAERWASGGGASASSVSITGFTIDGNMATYPLQAIPTADTIAYSGDSISEGFRAFGDTQPNDTDGEDVMAGHAWAICKSLASNFALIAFSGQGLNAGGNGEVPTLAQAWNYLHGGAVRVYPASLKAMIFNQGTNDGAAGTSSSTFMANYLAVLNGIRAEAPNCRFILIIPFNQAMASSIRSVAAQMSNTVVIETAPIQNLITSYDGIHPDAASHQGIIAPYLIPLVAAAVAPHARSYSFR
jgi:hypothetical protein